MQAYKITEHGDYIEITIDRDMVETEVIATYLVLSERKEFPVERVLWHIKGNIQPLGYHAIQNVINMTKSSFPPDAPKSRDAFVCKSAFVRAAAEIWAKAATSLPFEVNVFDDYDEAVKWLVQPIP